MWHSANPDGLKFEDFGDLKMKMSENGNKIWNVENVCGNELVLPITASAYTGV